MPNAYIELIDSLILQRQALKISQRELASAASTQLISRVAPISRRILHIQPFAVYRARLCVGL